MSAPFTERLYGLLPEFYRVRDNAAGEPLRALFGVIEREFSLIETDIATLYDNWFIETCEEWVVPYIGDLFGVRSIRSVESAGVSTRAYVANTLAYRRRKGTAAVLEQLARDTTGWPTRAVEFFSRLATTQHLNHVRRVPTATANIRDAASAELAEGPFDSFGHTAEVRRIGPRRGRYNIPNVGLFLWRLQSYRVGHGQPDSPEGDFATARRISATSNYYSFHPTGCKAPLFNEARTETTITHLAEEHNIPGKLRSLALHAELERARKYEKLAKAGKKLELDRLRKRDAARPLRFMTGPDPALRVFVQLSANAPLQEIARESMYVHKFPKEVNASPPPLAVAIDPERGRLKFLSAPHQVFVNYNYGFSGDLGGGPYDRTQSVDDASEISQLDPDSKVARKGFFDSNVWQIGVSRFQTGPGLVRTLREAANQWNKQSSATTGVIVIMDSVTEDDKVGSPSVPIEVRVQEGCRLLIVGGRWPLEYDYSSQTPVKKRFNGRFDPDDVRPHIIGDLVVRGVVGSPASPNAGACVLNGLLIEGNINVAPGNLRLLQVAHSTIVPKRGGIAIGSGNDRLRLKLLRTISGPLHIGDSVPIQRIEISESIIDAGSGSPAIAVQASTTEAQIDRSTVFGTVTVQTISASESIFTDVVRAARRQTGCVRFCYLPSESRVPRRFHCQPDLAVPAAIDKARAGASQRGITLSGIEEQVIRDGVRAVLKPLFESQLYGQPAYAQLERRCPAEIRTGGENGREMGAFSFLEQPQREANLRDALPEYLRFGLEAGLFFVT